jgi:hypothetical protein
MKVLAQAILAVILLAIILIAGAWAAGIVGHAAWDAFKAGWDAR